MLLDDYYDDLRERRTELQQAQAAAKGSREVVQIMRAMEAIDTVLSDVPNSGILEAGDPLVTKWERALERGEAPDLTEGLDRLPAKIRRKLGMDT